MTKILPYIIAFGGAFILTYVLTPLVREINRHFGMIDKPDARRINKVPVPRGGGVAVMLGVLVSFAIYLFATGMHPLNNSASPELFFKMATLGFAICLAGLADDKFSLHPLVKLSCQLAVAFAVWAWMGLGFQSLWPTIPAWADCLLTVFWIAGAINAFNLIDGLDGLASGLAFIATLGMAGSLIITSRAQEAIFHFAFAGGLFAFLRYNYHPASVFLGDSGSMFIGFILSVMPLASQTPNSFLVSVGVPVLAMGVPIFDTALAIVRRSIRRLIIKRNAAEALNGKVMTADSDHVHHRILRSVMANQRKAAWILYALAAFFVLVGLCGVALESRAAGLWIFAVAIASVVIFKDIARIELFDAGRLLNSVVRDRARNARRRLARLSVPAFVCLDVLSLVTMYFISSWALNINITREALRVALPIRVVSIFIALVFFNAYRTVWSRAMISNYMRLLLACTFGAMAGAATLFYLPHSFKVDNTAMTLAYASSSCIAIVIVRLFRGFVRDTFYAIDCNRLKIRKDVSRVLVYGSGLRYRAFRRELVRSVAANDRIIVGLLDDDILLRGHYIGGLKILGTLAQAPEIINAINADAVVVACEVTPEWMKIIRQTLEPTGVKITHFTFSEKPL